MQVHFRHLFITRFAVKEYVWFMKSAFVASLYIYIYYQWIHIFCCHKDLPHGRKKRTTKALVRLYIFTFHNLRFVEQFHSTWLWGKSCNLIEKHGINITKKQIYINTICNKCSKNKRITCAALLDITCWCKTVKKETDTKNGTHLSILECSTDWVSDATRKTRMYIYQCGVFFSTTNYFFFFCFSEFLSIYHVGNSFMQT